MKSHHPREEEEHQNVNKGKVCCLYVIKHLEVVISEQIPDVFLSGLLVST